MSIIANGRLVEYTNSPCSLQVFESGLIGAENVIVMLGGLTDGLMACSYVPKLSSLCAESGYALLQPILRSSYCQFGTGTLIRDMDDLINLFKWINKRSENFVFNEDEDGDDVGHKRSLSATFNALEENGVDTELLWDKIKDLVAKTIISIEPYLKHEYRAS